MNSPRRKIGRETYIPEQLENCGSGRAPECPRSAPRSNIGDGEITGSYHTNLLHGGRLRALNRKILRCNICSEKNREKIIGRIIFDRIMNIKLMK